MRLRTTPNKELSFSRNGASFGDCQEIPLMDESFFFYTDEMETLGTSDIFELGMISDGSHPAWIKIPQGWKGNGLRAMIDDVIKQVEHGLLQMVGFIGLQSQTAHCSWLAVGIRSDLASELHTRVLLVYGTLGTKAIAIMDGFF
jgi:hypothetical protein